MLWKKKKTEKSKTGKIILGMVILEDASYFDLEKFQIDYNNAYKDQILDLSDDNAVIKRKVDFTGGGLINAERDYARITLSTDKFLDYLKEDHIDTLQSIA